MRLHSLIPFSRHRRIRTIKIKCVLPPQPSIAIVFHGAPAVMLAGLFAAVLVLLGMAAAATVRDQSKAIADPALLALLLSAHAGIMLFALHRNAH